MGAGIAVVVAFAFGLDGVARSVLILQCSMPVAVLSYVFAQRWNNEPEEVAGLVVASTWLSIISIPALLAAVTISGAAMAGSAATASDAAPTPRTAESTTASPDALLVRGDTFFAAGDVTSARLFFEHAAAAGNGAAALRLGNTFDPAFLTGARVRVQGDPAVATSWYRRARDLGNSDAETLLRKIKMENIAR